MHANAALFAASDPATDLIVRACTEVHRVMGPGLPAPAYEAALVHELALRGLGARRQPPLLLRYKGLTIDPGRRADLVVDETVLVEVKTVERLLAVHEVRLRGCLRVARLRTGLLVNFHAPTLADGGVWRVDDGSAATITVACLSAPKM